MPNLRLVSVAALAGLGACGGDNVTPSASGVFPDQGFTGASLRVQISGNATTWGDDTMVDLGSGVTVNGITVASPTDVFADITIDSAAPTGLHDVTVTSGDIVTLKQAFELVTPISLSFNGDLDQGALPAFMITNLNFDQPFDTTTTPTITGPTGTVFAMQSATQLSITGFLYVDTTAVSGPVSVTSGDVTAVSDSVAINARAPTALPSGAPTTGMIANLDDTQLYSITAVASQLLHFSVSSTDVHATPSVALLPASGEWAQKVSSDYVFDQAGSYYAVVFDRGIESGYSFSITGTSDAITTVAEGDDIANGSNSTAPLAATLPYDQSPSTLSGAGDVDEIQIVVDAEHANLRLHIVTNQGPDPATDTRVELVNVNGIPFTVDPFLGFGPVDEDSGCNGSDVCASLGEDTLTDALPVGTYYLKVTAGSRFAPADNEYVALFWYE